jgi:acetylornithine deacetylase/succinyl-diaminopimelate desuccinylase-like protein
MKRALVVVAVLGLAGGHLEAQRVPDAPQVRDAVRAWRTGHESEILGALAGLLTIPNLASDGPNIRRNADAVAAMLGARGIATRLLDLEGSPPAVYGELRVPGATRTVVFYAHYDGQPVDTAQWRSPPWQVVLRDRPLEAGGREVALPAPGQRADPEARLYARSASDDKSPIMAMLAALDALRAAGLRPSVNLKFFFEGEEEAGSPHLRGMLTRYADLLRADAWIFCDGPAHQSRRPQVAFGARGVVGFGITVYGPNRALHSGHYGNWAPNPALLLAQLIASMRDTDGRILLAGFYDDVRPPTAEDRAALANIPPPDSALRDELGLAATEAGNALLAERVMLPGLNVQGLEAGHVGAGASNAIPTQATAAFDFRLVPDQTPAHLRELVVAHLERQGYHVVTSEPDSATRRLFPRIARLAWGSGYPANRTALDAPFSRAVVNALQPALPQPLLQMPILGGSLPLYHFVEVLHVPVVTLPTVNHDNNQHASNENLRLQNLWDAIEMFGILMVRLGPEWGTT